MRLESGIRKCYKRKEWLCRWYNWPESRHAPRQGLGVIIGLRNKGGHLARQSARPDARNMSPQLSIRMVLSSWALRTMARGGGKGSEEEDER